MQGGGGGSSVRLQWCGEQRMSWSSVLQNGLQPCWRLCVHQQGGFKFIMSRYMQPVEEAQYVWGWGLGLKTPAELWGWRCRRTDKWCNSNFCQEFNISWHNNWFLKYILKIILVLQWYITGWMVSQPLHPPITCVCAMPLQWAGRITVGNTLKAGLDYFFFTCCLLKWHYFAYFSCRLYIVGIPWTAKREICVLTLHMTLNTLNLELNLLSFLKATSCSYKLALLADSAQSTARERWCLEAGGWVTFSGQWHVDVTCSRDRKVLLLSSLWVETLWPHPHHWCHSRDLFSPAWTSLAGAFFFHFI